MHNLSEARRVLFKLIGVSPTPGVDQSKFVEAFASRPMTSERVTLDLRIARQHADHGGEFLATGHADIAAGLYGLSLAFLEGLVFDGCDKAHGVAQSLLDEAERHGIRGAVTIAAKAHLAEWGKL